MVRTPGPRSGPATRERLVTAACELYTTRGFLQTTTPMLAEHAGIAEGTIYRHFRSKEALLNACHRLALDWVSGVLKGSEAARGTGPRPRLDALARELVGRAQSHPAQVRLLFATDHDPFLDDPTLGQRRGMHDGLVQLIAMGKSDGLVRSGPAEVWAAVWWAVVALAAGRVAAGEWTADSGNVGLALEAAWDAIAAQQRASVPESR